MKVKLFIQRLDKEAYLEIKDNSKVIDLLKQLKIDHTTVLVSRNNELITEDVTLKNNDNLKILSVISGG